MNIRVVEDTTRLFYGIYFVDYIPKNDTWFLYSNKTFNLADKILFSLIQLDTNEDKVMYAPCYPISIILVTLKERIYIEILSFIFF